MAYSRRTVLKLVLGGAALSQAACINLSPFGSRKPATSRSERLDYGQLKIYYNDDVVVYLTREFHLVFKDVDDYFKFRKLPRQCAKYYHGISCGRFDGGRKTNHGQHESTRE